MIGDYALDILSEKYPDQDWISQASEAIALAAQRAIQQLSGMGQVTQNAPSLSDGASYAFPPRTREELLSKAEPVADSREVASDEDPIDPSTVLDTSVKKQTSKTPATPKGWLM